MKSTAYLALLRGINVGGKNIIRMLDLKACFEELGCRDVASFIQSGNVVFRFDGTPATQLAELVEQALSTRFRYQSRIVLLSYAQLKRVIERAPDGFGASPTQRKYDVIFFRKPLTAARAMKNLSLRDGVDDVSAGAGVVYFSRHIAKLQQSHLAKVVAHPDYQSMTIRNWNTTTRLLQLMDSTFARQKGN